MKILKIILWIIEFGLFISAGYITFTCTKFLSCQDNFICLHATLLIIIIGILCIINSSIILAQNFYED